MIGEALIVPVSPIVILAAAIVSVMLISQGVSACSTTGAFREFWSVMTVVAGLILGLASFICAIVTSLPN